MFSLLHFSFFFFLFQFFVIFHCFQSYSLLFYSFQFQFSYFSKKEKNNFLFKKIILRHSKIPLLPDSSQKFFWAFQLFLKDWTNPKTSLLTSIISKKIKFFIWNSSRSPNPTSPRFPIFFPKKIFFFQFLFCKILISWWISIVITSIFQENKPPHFIS